MPAQPAKTNVTVEAASPRDFQAGLPVIIGYDSSYGTANSPKKYFDIASVSTDHGASTKTTSAARKCFQNGARSVVIIKPTVTVVATESHGTTQNGSLTNKPSDTATVTVSVDGNSKTIVPVLTDPTADTVAAGDVELNYYTGEYKTGAVPSTSVSFGYSYIDFDAVVDALLTSIHSLGQYELFLLPDYDLDKAAFGDVKQLADVAEDNGWLVISKHAKAETEANCAEIRAALETQYVICIAHKSDDDVAAVVTGLASKTKPWVTLAFKKLRELDVDAYYLNSEVGEVDDPGTFEGDGVNVVHRIGQSDVLSNERTAVDYDTTATEEIYASRLRTRFYLERRINEDITALLLNTPKIGFDERGIGAVTSVVTRVLEEMVAENAITRNYVVTPPTLDSISDANKKKRSLGPFQVKCVMVESAHEIETEVTLEVA